MIVKQTIATQKGAICPIYYYMPHPSDQINVHRVKKSY